MNKTKLGEQEIQSRQEPPTYKLTREELEQEIFIILAGNDTKTLADQKAVCQRITQLFPPFHLTQCTLKEIIKQLRSCHYECEAGPLEKNTAFQALCELAEI